MEDLFKEALKKETFIKAGFIYRCHGAVLIDKIVDIPKKYADFVDGWLEAGSQFTSEEGIKQTFKIKQYHIETLSSYLSRVIENETLTENAYKVLLDILLKVPASIDNIIDLCAYGLLNYYESEEGILYIARHIDEIKNREYDYEDKRIVSLIEAAFCLYGRIDRKSVV